MSDIGRKISYWMNYAKYLFDTFNGRINPKFRASKIIFDRPNGIKDHLVFGQSILDEIHINIVDIFDYVNRYRITSMAKASALFVYSVLHELSHCDQDFIFTKDPEPQERANDNNVKNFVQINASNLEYILGEEVYFELTSYLLDKGDDINLYKPIQDPNEKVLRILEVLIDNIMIFEAVRNGHYDDVYIDYTDMYGQRQYGRIIKGGKWCSFESNCMFIKWITRNHSRLDVSVGVNEDRLLVLNVQQVSQEPYYPIVMC